MNPDRRADIHVFPNAAELPFVRQIEAALETPCTVPEEQYRQLFRENNWAKRIRDMLEIAFGEA